MTENELQDRRRTRLVDFVEANGGAASVVAKFRLAQSWPSQYVQIKNGSSFGSRAARNMEEKLNLPELYLDQGPMASEASNVGSAGAALTAAESLSASLRHIANAMIDADEIAVIQAKPLLTHLIDHPDQADKIIPRLVATLDGPSLSTETKDFVKTHAKQPS